MLPGEQVLTDITDGMMTREEVASLMRGSMSYEEWGRNCATVKRYCGGYPDFWYPAVLGSYVLENFLQRMDARFKAVAA